MKTHIARSVFDTLARLEQAVTVDTQTRDQGTPWLSANFRETLITSLAELRESSNAHGQVREAFLRIQKQRRSEIDELSRLVRDFFQVLRRRSNRHDHPEAIEAIFKRPARVPQWASVIEWLQWAQNIIRGEAQAQAMGYPAMTNPSAAEIAAAHQRASASEIQWSERIQLLKAQEQSLRQAREQGTRTLRGLAMRLRETLRHEAPATRRELMRTFGFSFISTGAKDRQKPSGPSQLHDLIKAVPRTQEDADPTLTKTIPTSNPNPNPAPAAITAPVKEASEATSVPKTDHQSLSAADPKPKTPTPEGPLVLEKAQKKAFEQKSKPKLSRRQKKALRRAQKAQITSNPTLQAISSSRICA